MRDEERLWLSPRPIGGIGPNSTKIAAELYRTVCKNYGVGLG